MHTYTHTHAHTQTDTHTHIWMHSELEYILFVGFKEKSHVGKLETYVWDKENYISQVSTYCAKVLVNYSDLTKRFNWRNKNGKLQYLWRGSGLKEGGVSESSYVNSYRSQPCKKKDWLHSILLTDSNAAHNYDSF